MPVAGGEPRSKRRRVAQRRAVIDDDDDDSEDPASEKEDASSASDADGAPSDGDDAAEPEQQAPRAPTLTAAQLMKRRVEVTDAKGGNKRQGQFTKKDERRARRRAPRNCVSSSRWTRYFSRGGYCVGGLPRMLAAEARA